jgi:hypothetical protein
MTNTNSISWESELLEIVKSTKTGIARGVDFAADQAPEVVGQLIAWKMTEACILAASWLIALAIVWGVVWRLWRMASDFTNTDRQFTRGLSCGIAAAISTPICCAFVGYSLDAIKIYVAPKVYLIEYLSALIK